MVPEVPFLASCQECCTRSGRLETVLRLHWPGRSTYTRTTTQPLGYLLPIARLSPLTLFVLQLQGTLSIKAQEVDPFTDLFL